MISLEQSGWVGGGGIREKRGNKTVLDFTTQFKFALLNAGDKVNLYSSKKRVFKSRNKANRQNLAFLYIYRYALNSHIDML